jgi:hypothetical protein
VHRDAIARSRRLDAEATGARSPFHSGYAGADAMDAQESAFLQAQAAASAAMVINQCDGCLRGLPINMHGHHVHPERGYQDAIACTAARYATPAGADVAALADVGGPVLVDSYAAVHVLRMAALLDAADGERALQLVRALARRAPTLAHDLPSQSGASDGPVHDPDRLLRRGADRRADDADHPAPLTDPVLLAARVQELEAENGRLVEQVWELEEQGWMNALLRAALVKAAAQLEVIAETVSRSTTSGPPTWWPPCAPRSRRCPECRPQCASSRPKLWPSTARHARRGATPCSRPRRLKPRSAGARRGR